MKRFRCVSPTVVTLMVSLWFVALCNMSLWRAVWRIHGGLTSANLLFLFSLFLFAVLFVNALLTLLVFPRIGKPLLILFLVVTSLAAYFMDSYGIVIDKSMIQNVLETNPKEAGELLSWTMAGYVVFLAGVPVWGLARIDIAYNRWWKELLRAGGVLVVTALCIVVILFFFYKDYASLLRNHRELRHMLTPTNYVGAIHGYLKAGYRNNPPVLQVLGKDAHLSPARLKAARKSVTVIVVGETARAENFSLGGYARKTNPELEKNDVIYFSNVSSCGTATATSLPCMFSNLGREGFDNAKASAQEGLLDVLAHAGIAVLWLDNNSGCKGACDRVQTEDLTHLQLPAVCREDECYDEVLLKGLEDHLNNLERDLVVVLHQKGSHGPSYFLRYPEAFEVFKPTCQSNQLEKCSSEEVINAYDNTIVYTDHMLAQVIGFLKKNSRRFDASMLYVSDHGESLGENGGVYLHGLPYSISPVEQRHVPMLIWLSEGFRARTEIDRACLASRRHEAYSHDNLFHSVLGLLDVKTGVYRPELDLFRVCRRN